MVKTYALIPDLHIPWHSRKGLSVCLSILDDLFKMKTLHTIILMGDVVDFFGVSLHPKLPYAMSVKETIKDEIYQANQFLEMLQRRYKGVKIVYIEGNHETRLLRYLVKKAPELFDMFTIPELMKLPERDIEFVPYGRNQLYQIPNTDLYTRHSPYSYAEHCTMMCLKKKLINLIFACTHRRQSVTIRDGAGQERSAYAAGCLIDFEAEVFGYMDTDNWAHCLNLSYVFPSGKWIMNQIPIKDGTAIYNGFVYEGTEEENF